MKNRQEIINYLAKRDLLDKIKENARMQGKDFEILIQREPEDIINQSMAWSRTPEGGEFWDGENDRFKDWLLQRETVNIKPQFLEGEQVKVFFDGNIAFEKYVYGANRNMVKYHNQTVTIKQVIANDHNPELFEVQDDGAMYYISEDGLENSWTSSQFKSIDNEYNAKLRKEEKEKEEKRLKEMEEEMSRFSKNTSTSSWYTYTNPPHPIFGF